MPKQKQEEKKYHLTEEKLAEIIIDWLKEERRNGCYIGNIVNISNVVVDGCPDFEKLIYKLTPKQND